MLKANELNFTVKAILFSVRQARLFTRVQFWQKILACVQLQFVKIGNAGGKTVKTLHECRKPKHVLETSVDEQEKQYTAVRLNREKPCPFCLFCFF